MQKPLCEGAHEIFDLRVRGLRPADELFIVTTGRKLSHNPTVYADPDVEYEWAWTRGMDAFLLVNSGTPYQKMVTEICKHTVRLDVWFDNENFGMSFSLWPDPSRINRPRRYWTYRLVPYSWTDTEIGVFERYLRRNTFDETGHRFR